MIHCALGCGDLPGTDLVQSWPEHYRAVHLDRPDIPDLNDWHTRAIAEVKRRAAAGGTWQMWEVFAVVGDPPNHRTANGQFSTEVEHLGIAHVTGYRKSNRPGTKSSAVAVWAAGPKPKQEAA